MHLPWLACIVCRSFFTIFWFSFPLLFVLLRDWVLLDGGLCFSLAHPFSVTPSCHTALSFLLWSCLPQSCWASLGLPFILLPMAQYSHWFFYVLGHLFSLKRPGPVCFPWTFPALFLTLYSPKLLLNSLDFPDPITLSLILRAHGFAINPLFSFFHYFGSVVAHSCFSTSYIAHDLLFLSFRAPLSPFTSSRPFYFILFFLISWVCDPLFLPFGLNDFSFYLPNFFLSVLLGFFFPLGLSKWPSTILYTI